MFLPMFSESDLGIILDKSFIFFILLIQKCVWATKFCANHEGIANIFDFSFLCLEIASVSVTSFLVLKTDDQIGRIFN